VNIVNVGYDSTNYYVVEQAGKLLLIDVGWPGTLPKLSASLKHKGIALGPLSYLLITHYHPDHAGLVQDLKDKGVLHIILEQQLPAIPLLKMYMKADSGYVDIHIEDSLQLSTADSRAWLSGGGMSGEIVSTPGHSADSLSLVLDDGMAFIGDLLPPELATVENLDATRQSWARLRALHVKTVYPGHGPVIAMP